MEDLRSAPLAPVGSSDHIRGTLGAPIVVEYADFECPFCALLHTRLSALRLRRVFRHFPMRSKHPRAWPAAAAVEAADRQGAFWPMHDALFADQGRLEDPHIWRRAEQLGLDLERFEADRRDPTTIAKIQHHFDAAIRAGVVTTPTIFIANEPFAGAPTPELLSRLAALTRT